MKKNKDDRLLSASLIKLVVTKRFTTGLSDRAIAKSVNVSGNTVTRISRRAIELGINSPSEIYDLPPNKIVSLFYPSTTEVQPRLTHVNKLMPKFQDLAKQVIETKAEQKVLFANYKQEAEAKGLEAFTQSYFCGRLKQEVDQLKSLEPDFYFAQQFPYGMYLQIDFSGDTYKLATFNGEQSCWLMVICFPASYYVYAEFVTAQSTAESCRVIGNMVRALGKRAPSIAVVDNARCFVNKHSGSEAIINRNFEEYMHSIGMCVEAAPVRHPQAKSAVEYSVRLAQNALGSMKSLFSGTTRTLTNHNRVLKEKIDTIINQGPFRKSIDKTREYLFLNYELPTLCPVERIPNYLGDVTTVIVPRSYLITVKEHQYSVPYLYIKKKVDVYVSNDVVVIKFEGKEIARHQRTDGAGQTIVEAHRPATHQEIEKNKKIYATPEDVLRISKDIDSSVHRFCQSRLKYDEQNNKSMSNSIRCCRAVINFYKRSPFKDLYAEACDSLLSQPPELWNSYKLRELYDQVTREYISTYKVEHQTELFRPSNDDDAYIRNYEDELEIR